MLRLGNRPGRPGAQLPLARLLSGSPVPPQHSGTPLDTVLLRPGCVSMRGRSHLKMGWDLVNNPQQLGSCNRQGCLSYPLLLRPVLDLWPVVQATCLSLQFPLPPRAWNKDLGSEHLFGNWSALWGSDDNQAPGKVSPMPSSTQGLQRGQDWKVFSVVPTAHWSKVAPGVLTHWHWSSAHGRKFTARGSSLQATSGVGWASMGRVPTASEFSRGTSLVVQWLRIHPPMQGVRVQSLVGELRSHKTQGQKSQNINNNMLSQLQ